MGVGGGGGGGKGSRAGAGVELLMANIRSQSRLIKGRGGVGGMDTNNAQRENMWPGQLLGTV